MIQKRKQTFQDAYSGPSSRCSSLWPRSQVAQVAFPLAFPLLMNTLRAGRLGLLAPSSRHPILIVKTSWLIALAFLIGGCDVVEVTGPETAVVGSVVQFEIVYEVTFDPWPVPDGTPVVAALLPTEWEVERASYHSNRTGHGTPEVLEWNSTRCDFGGPAPDGFRYVYFYGPFSFFENGDRGTLTADFRVGSPGVYDLTFWGSALTGRICGESRSTTVTVHEATEVPAMSTGGLVVFLVVLALAGTRSLNA